MRPEPLARILRAVPLLAALALTQCRREPPPLPPPPAPQEELDPWSFHFVGGLLVITGEMAASQDITLKGTTLNEARTLPLGPVRWELLRPPPGEVAELRTSSGQLLMKFDFNAPPPARAPQPPHVPPPQAAPPKPAPPPPPARPSPAPAAPPRIRSTWPVRPSVPPAPARPKPAPIPPAVPPAGASRSSVVPQPPPRPLPALMPPPPIQAPPVKAVSTLLMKPSFSLVPPPQALAPHPPALFPVLPAPKAAPSVPKAPAKPELPGATPVPAPRPASPLPPALPSIPDSAALAWPGAGEGLNLLRGPKGERRICMTFDGGSTSEVAVDVLDALKSRGIRTTIFLTGDFIHKYPDLVRRMDREGHELGNHTLNHPHLAPSMHRDPRWTRERFQQELLDADRALFKLLGRPFDPYWRAPYGEQTPELRKWAEELGYRHVGWSEGADTLDWATIKERRLYRTGNAILDKLRVRMEKQDGDGLIVLMHLGSGRPDGDRPAQVLGAFLDRAIQDGWHFVSIGEYVKGLGKPRWEPVRRVALLR